MGQAPGRRAARSDAADRRDHVHRWDSTRTASSATRGWLIIVQSNTGQLFRVNPRSGTTKLIDTHGYSVLNGDGLEVRGRTLFVIRNTDNLVAVMKLGWSLKSATFRFKLDLRLARRPDYRGLVARSPVGGQRSVHHPADADHEVLDQPAPAKS